MGFKHLFRSRNLHKPGHFLIFCGLFFICLSATTSGQDFEALRPKIPEAHKGSLRFDGSLSPAIADDAVILDELRGIVILGDSASYNPDGHQAFGLTIHDQPILEDESLKRELNTHIGKPLSIARLTKIAQTIVLHYRANDIPLIDAIAPEGQDISNGVVQFIVIEGRLGKLEIQGSTQNDGDFYRSQIHTGLGETIYESTMLADLDWLNSYPFRQVDVVYKRGEAQGESDATLRVLERDRLRAYGGYEDSGNDTTGDARFFAGFNLGHALGEDRLFSYQLTTSNDYEQVRAHSLSYIIPIHQLRHTLTLHGSHVRTRGNLPNSFSLQGLSWQIGARYNIPMRRIFNASRRISIEYDFKRNNNNLQFGGSDIFNTFVDVSQFSIVHNIDREDRYGAMKLGLQLSYSPGEMSKFNKNRFYEGARSHSESDYLYTRANLDRVTMLPGRFSHNLESGGQIANNRLPGTEQFGLGGYNSLRGYDEREVNGDSGAFIRNELYTPGFGIKRWGESNAKPDRLQFLSFYDMGWVRVNGAQSGEKQLTSMRSAGAGLRYVIGNTFTLRLDYAWQLKDSGQNTRNNRRMHLGAVLSF